MNAAASHISKKLHFALLLCVACSLPFYPSHVQLNSFFIILLAACWPFVFFFNKAEINPKHTGLMILFAAVFLAHIAGLANTDNLKEAVFELQKKLSLLLFPVVLFYSPALALRQVRVLLIAFVTVCVISGLLCLSGALYIYITENDSSFFFTHKLSNIAGMHANYLAMYYCFSIATCIYILESSALSRRSRLAAVTAGAFLLILIFLLLARIQIALTVTGIVIYLVYFSYKRKNIKIPLLIFFALMILASMLVIYSPVTREKLKEAINYKSQYSIDKQWGGRALRELKWNCALELIREHPFSGVGTGDVLDELQQCYTEHNYGSLLFWENTRYNAHNQFLEITAELGIPGFLVFSLSLVAALYHAWRKKKIVYAVFILLFLVSCFTESMLERQNGIVFYAFFNSLFAFHSGKPDQE